MAKSQLPVNPPTGIYYGNVKKWLICHSEKPRQGFRYFILQRCFSRISCYIVLWDSRGSIAARDLCLNRLDLNYWSPRWL